MTPPRGGGARHTERLHVALTRAELEGLRALAKQYGESQGSLARLSIRRLLGLPSRLDAFPPEGTDPASTSATTETADEIHDAHAVAVAAGLRAPSRLRGV